ncbi:hemerythrin domain-containing protein [Streptomyces sp. NPDC058469]|uniref:hemerythrin domain-containing protein n=1 Tax=Streptomyces sp. NPDC058469 TaxID=3346514 RepID=UPI00364E2162
MSVAHNVERPYTHEMVIVHRVFRREAALLPQLVRATQVGDIARAEQIARHVDEYVGGLHHHHGLEDELIWPLLCERAPLSDGLITRMQEQHQLIDMTLAVVTDALSRWRRSADADSGESLANGFDDHYNVLLRHLHDEETQILPLIADHLTVAEWDLVGTRGLERIPKNKLMLALGAILEDATEKERRYFLGKVPLVGRFLWRVVGRRQYAAQCRELRGPLAG